MDAVLEHELAGIKELLTSAELTEAKARALRVPETVGICDHPYGLEACEDCEYREGCSAVQDMRENDAIPLFAQAWQSYREIEGRLRDCLRKDETVEGMAMLARVLLDTHIHPGSGMYNDSDFLWEAEYWWLRLYYRTGDTCWFEQAKLCDGIRHAVIEEITE